MFYCLHFLDKVGSKQFAEGEGVETGRDGQGA